MTGLKGLQIWAIVILGLILPQAGWAPPLCPSGYTYYQRFPNIVDVPGVDWRVCINSAYYEAPEEGEVEEQSMDYCPLVIKNNHQQAFNQEARICFQTHTGGSGVFVVTRDFNYGHIKVDKFNNFYGAGCSTGSNDTYLISPGDVYCLKDVGDSESSSIDHIDFDLLLIEEYLDYFDYENPCENDDCTPNVSRIIGMPN